MNLKMNNLIAAFSILMLSSKLLGQEQLNLVSPTKVTTIGYWNIGDKITYHVTTSDVTNKSNATQPTKPTKQSSNTYDLEIKVVDSTEHSYKLEMRYLNASAEGVDPRLKEMMSSFQTAAVIRYQTDEFGIFQKILNTTELQKDFQKKGEEFKKQVAVNRSPEEAKASIAVLDGLLVEFSKPENIEVLYLGDIMAIHGNYGMELNLNKALDIDIEMPCLMDIVVNGTGKITLQSINKAKDIAIISIKYKPNQDELKKYMKTFFELFVPKDSKEFKVDDMKIDFENTEKLQMYLSSGWMESIQTSRTVSASFEDEKIKKVTTATYLSK